MNNLIAIRTILSVAIVLCLAACGSPNIRIAPGMVVVSGHITGCDSLSPKTVVANFQNPFDDGGSSRVVSLDTDGSFRFEYEMPYGQTINIRYGNRFISFYGAPGDNIGLTVDASQLYNDDILRVVAFSGDRAETNTRYSAAFEHFSAMNVEFDDALSPEEFTKAVDEHLSACRDSLDAYARREKLTKEEIRLLDNEIVGSTLYYASGWRYDEPQTETIRRLFTEVVDILDSRYASSPLYGNNVLFGYMMRCLVDPALPETPAALMPEFLRTMGSQPVGLARDIMVYATFAQFGGMFPDLLDTFASEARVLLDSDYAIARFDKLMTPDVSEFEPLSLTGISRITAEGATEPLPEIDMFGYLAEKHPGKVIYVDIAAHWCGPCIAEIPHMKRLEESLAGEDVVFVTLWLESDRDYTMKLLREHDLRGENYFFTTDASRLFDSHYGMSGFPTYMLLDRIGKLADRNAGRPSGEGTSGQIRELLR